MTFWKKISWTRINNWLAGEEKIKTKAEIYAERKQDFISGLDSRQKLFYDQNRGASWTEMILGLEERIYKLETELETMPRIPTLVDIVLPVSKPIVKKPRVKKIVRPMIEVLTPSFPIPPLPVSKPVPKPRKTKAIVVEPNAKITIEPVLTVQKKPGRKTK